MANYQNLPEPKPDKNGKPSFPPSAEMEKIARQHDKAIARATEEKSAPPRIYEPRCHVCTSPYRDWIEYKVAVEGLPYLAIEKSLPVDSDIKRRSISKHAREHMSVTQAAYRAILEEEASLERQDFNEGVRGAITKHGILEIMMRKGFQDVMDDTTIVEPKDLIQIIKLKADMDERAATMQIEEAKAQVAIFTEAILNIVTPEVRDQIAAEVRRLRRMRQESVEYEQVLRPQLEASAEEV